MVSDFLGTRQNKQNNSPEIEKERHHTHLSRSFMAESDIRILSVTKKPADEKNEALDSRARRACLDRPRSQRYSRTLLLPCSSHPAATSPGVFSSAFPQNLPPPPPHISLPHLLVHATPAMDPRRSAPHREGKRGSVAGSEGASQDRTLPQISR